MPRLTKRGAYKKKRMKKRGLTKVESKEVKKIAKSVVNTMVESKYFDTQDNDSVSQVPPAYAWYDSDDAILSPVCVYGNITGYNRSVSQTGTEQIWTYGKKTNGTSQGMTTFNMNRLYDNSTLLHTPNLLEGATCRPSFAQSQLMFERILQRS